jgi:cation/acetate symporter
MSVDVWTWILVGITFVAYIFIGYRARVRDTSGFYVAGRGIPAVANGAATAADWMSAASFISMAGLISFMGNGTGGYDGTVYLMGWTGGYVLLTLLLAPYLRKFGKYTVPDFVAERYYSDTARVVAAICAIFVSFTYVSGQMRGVGIVFSRYLGVSIEVGVIVGVAVVAFFAVIGGMKGITWTQVAQYTVLIVAYLIPAIAIASILTSIFVPQLALVFSDITSRLNTLQTDLGFEEYTKPFTAQSGLNVFMITMALMIGTAGLPHIIVRFYTVRTVSKARWSGAWALLFIALLYTTAPAIAVFAKYNLIDSLNGKTDAEVQALDWVPPWEDTKLLAFEDKNGDGVYTYGPDKETNEITIDRDIIVLANPQVAGLANIIVALVAAGGLAAALSTAAGLLLVISSALAHDIYFKMLDPKADERRRLLVGRLMIFVAVVIAGYFGIRPPGFVAEVVAFAFGLAAATFFPIIVLGIFDKRMNKEGAIAGMLVGLIFTAFYIVGTRFFDMDTWFFDIGAQGIGTIGAIFNFIVAMVVSRVTSPPPQEIQDFVENVRIPRGAGQASH